MSDAIGSTAVSPLSAGSRLRADLIRLRSSEERALTARESADLNSFSRSLQTALNANRDTARETPTARQPSREPPPRVQEAAQSLISAVDQIGRERDDQTTPRGAVLDIVV